MIKKPSNLGPAPPLRSEAGLRGWDWRSAESLGDLTSDHRYINWTPGGHEELVGSRSGETATARMNKVRPGAPRNEWVTAHSEIRRLWRKKRKALDKPLTFSVGKIDNRTARINPNSKRNIIIYLKLSFIHLVCVFGPVCQLCPRGSGASEWNGAQGHLGPRGHDPRPARRIHQRCHPGCPRSSYN